MLKHKGTVMLESSRLVLRKAIMEDAPAMFRNWASDPEVTKYLTWPPHASVEVTERILREWTRGYVNEEVYQWMIVLKEEGDEPIGSICAMLRREDTGCFEIGYCMGKKWWHKGLMSEALGTVIHFLFDQVGALRVEARHDPRNPRSGGVMRKCGMRLEGTLRQAGRNTQGICDEVVYAIVPADGETHRHFAEGIVVGSDDSLVREIYERFPEEQRLSATKAARVEFLTTVRYVEKYLIPGAKILDIGAGPGAYSLHFAGRGYEVSALELSERNLEVLRSRIVPGMPLEAVQGNALDLSRYADDSFDVVLLLGPLYHLHRWEDRLRAIAEAKRVCKPGGKLFFAFIANDIVILTMQQIDPGYLLTGDFDRETFRLDDFPFVFHTVERSRALLTEAGISLIHEVASDGVSELLADLINAMDEETYQQYLRYHFYICEKPENLGMSNHLLFVGEK